MLWHTFEEDRPLLEKQFKEPCWNRESGLEPAALYERCLEIAEAEDGQPRIRTKAHLFRFILEHAQIEVCLLYTSPSPRDS